MERSSRNLIVAAVLGGAAAMMAAGAVQSDPVVPRWSVEKAAAWGVANPWWCGVNYIPANAINYTAMWDKTSFSPDVIRRELKLMTDLGMNCVRFVMQYKVYEDDPAYFVETLDKFLSLCDEAKVKAMPIFFDDCVFGVNRDPVIGRQPEPLEGWYAWAWSPSPGHTMVIDEREHPKLEKYVKDVLSRFKDDKRIFLWDLYNEPTSSGLKKRSFPLLSKTFKWAREVDPSQPISSGIWNNDKDLNNILIENSDIVTFHCYANGPKTAARVKEVKALAKGRPVICTEWMNRPVGSTVAACIPIFKEAGVGCMAWGLVNGKTQTHLKYGHRPEMLPYNGEWQHDLYRGDLTPYDAAEIDLVKAAIGRESKQMPGMKTVWGEKVAPENAWREYPRPQMVRANWTNLNGLWQYAVTKDAPGSPAKWDGEILVPFVIESALSGVGRLVEPDETLWYKRSFEADVQSGERLLLHFEQADFRAMVYVNGRELDVPHEGGQMPFSYDMTDFVKKGTNELVVAIWDPTASFIGSFGKQSVKPKGCFYTRSSGIGGTVWLETVPSAYIAGYKVTPDIDKGEVTFSFECCQCGNVANEQLELEIGTGSTDDTGNNASATLRLCVRETFKPGKPVTVKMPKDFECWSPENPKLYRFTAKYGKDEIKGYFGMRKIEVRKDANGVLRIFFNNKPRFLIGTLDQGWWPDGLLTPPSDEAMAYDIRKLKEMGYDMMRKHIKVEPRRYYHLCDVLGIMVMQDMPSGAGDRTQRYGFYRRELKDMIDHLYNSPSIVSWVPYNENWGQPGEFLTHATLVWTQKYDPSRIVDGPSGWHDYEGGNKGPHKPAGVEEAADLIDKHDYGKRPGMWPLNDRRASFLGEFGGIGCRVDGHLWTDKAWGYGNTGNDVDRKAVQDKIVSLMDHVANLAMSGLAGCVYTQTTDVEGEINGLITYDRKVVKFDEKALSEVHGRVRRAAERGAMRAEKVAVAVTEDDKVAAVKARQSAGGQYRDLGLSADEETGTATCKSL